MPQDGFTDARVVDGQQRLATVSVVRAQIRDYFLFNNEAEQATLESEFLLKRDLRSQEAVPSLSVRTADDVRKLENGFETSSGSTTLRTS